MESNQEQHLTIDDAMQLATQQHRSGNLEDAGILYQRILELVPDHPDALHFLGLLAHQKGQDGEALRLMRRSVELVPTHVDFVCNLGNLLFSGEHFEDAERTYLQALERAPDRPDILNNYAVLCKGLGRLEEAERAFLKAIDLAPDFSDARNNLANMYLRTGRIEEAIKQSCEALVGNKNPDGTREVLGKAYSLLKRFDEAAKVYRDWLEIEPGNPRAMHYLAACTGQNIPERASDAYVKSVFDSFSESFDSTLAKLEYRAPKIVLRTVLGELGERIQPMDVLDAGCGTGLCGPLFKPYAQKLTGIDLSDGMLNKARGRGVYDHLQQAELTAYLQAHPESAQLIISADTLVYFGALDAALQAAASALRSGGYLCFTVEALDNGDGDDGDYQLQPHGRYAHSQAYLQKILALAGLNAIKLEAEILRNEGGKPVNGWVVLARKSA